jgi:hypothetical protein
MKHSLQHAARMANQDLPGGAAKIVMDSPLYPVHLFAPLVARFALTLALPRGHGLRDTEFKVSRFEPAFEVSFHRILTLKSRRTPPIQSCRKTGSGYRKQPGGKTGGRLIKGPPRGRDVAQ